MGFYRGWAMTLAFMGQFPLIGISGAVFASSISSGTASSLKSYAQSAGYAEQALSAIRVVAANSMEK
jgi:ABC-type multidrug transport system fused ATPase/permease subunit